MSRGDIIKHVSYLTKSLPGVKATGYKRPRSGSGGCPFVFFLFLLHRHISLSLFMDWDIRQVSALSFLIELSLNYLLEALKISIFQNFSVDKNSGNSANPCLPAVLYIPGN